MFGVFKDFFPDLVFSVFILAKERTRFHGGGLSGFH